MPVTASASASASVSPSDRRRARKLVRWTVVSTASREQHDLRTTPLLPAPRVLHTPGEPALLVHQPTSCTLAHALVPVKERWLKPAWTSPNGVSTPRHPQGTDSAGALLTPSSR